MELKREYDLCRLAIILILIFIFLFIAWNIQFQNTERFDQRVDTWVYSLRNPLTKSILIPITYLGNWFSIVPLILLLMLLPKMRWHFGIPAALTGIPGFLLYAILKRSFARPRPDVALHLIEQGGFSFPSGHSMNGMICYGILLYLIVRNVPARPLARGLSVLLAFLIFLIGFSRIFVGVHFVTDVLGGWSLGLAFLLAATLLLERRYFPWLDEGANDRVTY